MISILAMTGCAGITLYGMKSYQNTSCIPLRDKSLYTIEQIHSTVDADGDGMDDQTDMLQGVISYLNTKPKYKSKYYNTGYSNDSYGVCTDVVANGMKSAGYDLMVLVEKDIREHPKDYNIEEPDANIDFRRVKNLQVYFSHKGIPLTIDISKIEEWQGGDIVIFSNHIGVISERRNSRGVPYVLHHNGPWQRSYEQDILEKRKDIVAHYRISQ